MKRWTEIDIGESLFDILEGYSFKQLNIARYKYNIHSEEFNDMDELMRAVGSKILEAFKDHIPCLDYERYSILKRIADGEGIENQCDAHSLYSFLISDMALKSNKEDGICILPVELFNIFRELDSPFMKENAKRNSELYQLINGCLVSYGLIDIAKLKAIVEKHIGYEINDIDFRKLLDSCELVHGMILTEEPLVISRNMDIKRVPYFISEQEKVNMFDYKEFAKEELLHASNFLYVPETPCYWKLIMMLKRYFHCSEEISRCSAAILINNAKACREFDESMKFIVQELGYVTGAFMGEFMPFYGELNNCTGKWALKGHTPNEITKILDPELYKKAQEMQENDEGPGRIIPFAVPQEPIVKSTSINNNGKKYMN